MAAGISNEAFSEVNDFIIHDNIFNNISCIMVFLSLNKVLQVFLF